MVDRLRVVMTTIEKLQSEQQERIAQTVEELLEEHEGFVNSIRCFNVVY